MDVKFSKTLTPEMWKSMKSMTPETLMRFISNIDRDWHELILSIEERARAESLLLNAEYQKDLEERQSKFEDLQRKYDQLLKSLIRISNHEK